MTIGITANIDKDQVRKFIPDVLKWLKRKNVSFFVEEKLARFLNLPENDFAQAKLENFCQKCQMVVSFGGDGTILSTVRAIGKSGIPILGVKIGGMGFLAELTPEEFYEDFEEILAGRYQIVERMVLQAELKSESDKVYALNDFVMDKGAVSRVVAIKTYINDEFLNNYIGDGIIISTPTGSTAYSLAANGPILLPSMDAIIINPINPHSLGARPVVIPGDCEVKIEIVSSPQSVLLSVDGQVFKELSPGQTARFKKGDYRVRLVTHGGRSFYDVLRAKLNWGEDVRSL